MINNEERIIRQLNEISDEIVENNPDISSIEVRSGRWVSHHCWDKIAKESSGYFKILALVDELEFQKEYE